MNKEQQNRMSASLFRLIFLMKCMSYEFEFFIKFPLPSGIKNILFRANAVFGSIITDLKRHLPNSKKQIDDQVIHSDNKIRAISTILEKLAVLDEETVLEIESSFDKQVIVKY